MAKQASQQVLFRLALLGEGEREVPGQSRKYIVMTRSNSAVPSPRFYYLGKSGALRTGGTIAGSIPVGPKRREQLLAAGKAVVEAAAPYTVAV